MESWIVGFLKDYGAMATVVAAALALGIPALVRLGAMGQRFTLLEQHIGSLEQGVEQRFVSLEQGVDQRFVSLEQGVEQQFVSLEQGVDQQFVSLEQGVEQRFVSLEQRVDQRFVSLEKLMDQRFISLEKLMDQRFTTVEQRLDAVESEIQTEMKPAMVQIREGVSDLEREVAVQSERINGMNERMTNSFMHLRELIDERIPKRG